MNIWDNKINEIFPVVSIDGNDITSVFVDDFVKRYSRKKRSFIEKKANPKIKNKKVKKVETCLELSRGVVIDSPINAINVIRFFDTLKRTKIKEVFFKENKMNFSFSFNDALYSFYK